jgi:oligopeptide transport system substrate-binding protein
MPRSWLPTVTLSAVLGFACGCARQDGAASGPAGGRQEKVLRVGNGAEPQDLDPGAVTGVPELNILDSLFEGLVAADPHDLHPIPGLAESWDVSPDLLVYTFHLRANLHWSNGDPITAEDFVETYKRTLTPIFSSQISYLLWSVVGAEDYNRGALSDFSKVGFRATDDRTLRVTLRRRTPYLLKILATDYVWDPLPIRVLARYGPLDRKDTGWTKAGRLVSSGPFLLKEWAPDQKVVVVRNPLYWDAAHVKLDAIEFYPVVETATEERMFRTGQLDVTQQLPVSKIEVYRQEHPDELRVDPYLGVYFYRCNVTRPPLNDVRVRRALALAIDREKLVQDVVKGGEEPAYAVSYPNDAGYTPAARLSGGVAEAQRLLAEAGYPGGKGLPTIELHYNTFKEHQDIAEAIQAMWLKNLGVRITLRNEDWKVYLDSQHTHNYQLSRSGWIADYLDPHVFLEIWETGNGNNDTLWSNPEYDRLLHSALDADTEEGRYAIYQKLDAILVQECPVLPVYYYTSFYLKSPRVRGWWPTLLNIHPWKFVDLDNN